ncbi:MAG: hypothetical protein WCJ76_02205 [Comamonadaceae bacterium]
MSWFGPSLQAEPNFNVDIILPIVLPGLANCFKVTFRFVTAQGQEMGDASKAVVVAQLVLDDGVFKYFMHNRFIFDYVCKNVLWS